MGKTIKRLSKMSAEERRYWVPILLGMGLSIILFGLTTIRSEGISSDAGWVTLSCGIGMFLWGARWTKYVGTSASDEHD